MSQNDLVYLAALKASESTEAPGIGLSSNFWSDLNLCPVSSFLSDPESTEAPGIGLSSSTDKLSVPSGVKTLIRQNNTIIELCVKLSKQVESLEARIRSLEAQKSHAVPEDLITKLENLSLGAKERPKESKGLLRVHRNPNKLLQDELDKLKLKHI